MVRTLNELVQRIDDITVDVPFAVHWDVRDLTSGQRTGQGEHNVVGAFSTRKVSVLLACLALVHRQKLSLDDMYVIDEELKDGVQAGVMRNLSAGLELSLRDHLAQMMITSDNICTQLVFRAIEDATGDALQWVNDYCAHLGMHHTLHREIFPRSAELSWTHSLEHMTVTTAHDQALVLAHLARAATDEQYATQLGLSPALCELGIELMSHLYTPFFGAYATDGHFVEKNGRGIRGLSQVGILFDENHEAVASLAVFADAVPTQLLDGTPGRMRAWETFANIGQAVEEFFCDGEQIPVVPRQVIASDFWEQELGELLFAVDDGRTVNADVEFTFSGIGKLFFAHTLVRLADEHPGLLTATIPVTAEHRAHAETGTLRHLTGALHLRIEDAIRLMITTGDAAAVLAILDHLNQLDIDVLACGRANVEHLPQTTITAMEESSAGEGFRGTTTAKDVLAFLCDTIAEDGLLLHCMSQVFEPSGLGSSLPGYGPHTVEHWTVAGWERMYHSRLDEGRTSVLILNCPKGKTAMVAHAPVGTHHVPVKFGSLGLSCLVRG